jgi:hypothetical protein
MTIETIDPTVTNAAIDAETNRLINSTLQKHGLTLEQLNQQCPGAAEDARRTAREFVEREQEIAANPVYQQLQAEREAHKLTKMQLEAMKQTRVAVGNDVQPVADVAVVRARLGERDWYALTDNGRLQSCGIDPNKVTPLVREECKKLFGRGADSHYANDFYKSNAGQYRNLKNIAIVLGIQGM